MRHLALTPSSGGDVRVWEQPQPGWRYIVACDNAMGRGGKKADTSCIGVWKRRAFRNIELVAMYRGRHDAGLVGEQIACWARAYGGQFNDETGKEEQCAIVNIERNLCDFPHDRLINDQMFPLEFCFVGRDMQARAKENDGQFRWYTQKHTSNARYLADTWLDYWRRRAIIVRDAEMRGEIRGVTRDMRTDYLETGGKDGAAMSIIACVTDQELPAVTDEPEPLGPVAPPKSALVRAYGMVPPEQPESGRRHNAIHGFYRPV